MRKIISKLFDVTFWKFVAVGVANTLFGTAIMFLFYNLFHFNYWISSAANYIFGSILSYILNRIFTFSSNETTKRTLPKFVLNISICYLLAYGIAKPLAVCMLSGLTKNVQENIAMLIGMCLFVALNYIGQRFFVFRAEQKKKQ